MLGRLINGNFTAEKSLSCMTTLYNPVCSFFGKTLGEATRMDGPINDNQLHLLEMIIITQYNNYFKHKIMNETLVAIYFAMIIVSVMSTLNNRNIKNSI